MQIIKQSCYIAKAPNDFNNILKHTYLVVKQLNPVQIEDSHTWKTIGMVSKYVAIELVIQYSFLCCLPYDRFGNHVIYERQAWTIQQVIVFILDA